MSRDIEMGISENNIVLRPLEYADAERIRRWGINESPLLTGYNYGAMDASEAEFWVRSKCGFRKDYYAIDIPGRKLIGYLGVREINYFRRKAVLGIVLDPAYQSAGYGTGALNLFLERFFADGKMRSIELEVNKFNDRALALYQSAGFVICGETTERFENQSLDFKDPRVSPYADCFERRGGVIYSKLWRMRKEVNR